MLTDLTCVGAFFTMSKVCGIYKITSPSGNIYIGQSIDIFARKKAYKNGAAKQQTRLGRSFIKYGFHSHVFEVLVECNRDSLNDLEIYYIKLFDTFNTKHGLNLKAGGQNGGVNCEEVRQKLRKPKSDVAKENYRKSAFNRPKVSDETREKHRQRMMGNTHLKGSTHMIGKKHTEEAKEKIRRNTPVGIGEDNFNSKLTWEKVNRIRELAKQKIHYKIIIAEFGISNGLFYAIKNNKNWKK